MKQAGQRPAPTLPSGELSAGPSAELTQAAGQAEGSRTAGGSRARRVVSKLAGTRQRAQSTVASQVTALQARAAALREQVAGQAEAATNQLDGRHHAEVAAVRQAVGDARGAIAATRHQARRQILAAGSASRQKVPRAHQQQQAAARQEVSGTVARVRRAGDEQAARARAGTEQQARVVEGHAARAPKQGERASVEAQSTAAGRIAARAAGQIRQTGMDVAAAVRQEAGQAAASRFDDILAQHLRVLGQAATESGRLIADLERRALAEVDRVAAESDRAAAALGEHATAGLGRLRRDGQAKVVDWQRTTTASIDRAAIRVARALREAAEGALAELESGLAPSVAQLAATSGGEGAGGGDLDDAATAAEARILEDLGAAGLGAGERLEAGVTEARGGLAHVVQSVGSGLTSGRTEMVAKIVAARGDASAGLLGVATSFRERAEGAVGDTVGRFEEMTQQLRTQLAGPAGELTGGLARLVDDGLASADGLVVEAKAKIDGALGEIAGKYATLKQQAEARSAAEGESASRLPIQRFLGSLWRGAMRLVDRVKQWFADTFGEFWGGLLFGILAALVIVAVGLLVGFVVGKIVAFFIVSAKVALIVTAVIMVVAALTLGIVARFQEFADDNPGQSPSFWQALGLIGLGIADLTGIPYIIEGIVGQRAFGKELTSFERGERIGMGVVFIVAFGVTIGRGVGALLRGKAPVEPGRTGGEPAGGRTTEGPGTGQGERPTSGGGAERPAVRDPRTVVIEGTTNHEKFNFVRRLILETPPGQRAETARILFERLKSESGGTWGASEHVGADGGLYWTGEGAPFIFAIDPAGNVFQGRLGPSTLIHEGGGRFRVDYTTLEAKSAATPAPAP